MSDYLVPISFVVLLIYLCTYFGGVDPQIVSEKNTLVRFPGDAVVKNPPAMQGTWVRALVWEDPTCHGAAKPMSHNY